MQRANLIAHISVDTGECPYVFDEPECGKVRVVFLSDLHVGENCTPIPYNGTDDCACISARSCGDGKSQSQSQSQS